MVASMARLMRVMQAKIILLLCKQQDGTLDDYMSLPLSLVHDPPQSCTCLSDLLNIVESLFSNFQSVSSLNMDKKLVCRVWNHPHPQVCWG